MKDYRKLVSRKPPEGLLASAMDRLDTAGLTYEVEWVPDNSMGALITDSVRKVKMVRCHCSACGSSPLLEWAPPANNYRGTAHTYGFWDPEDGGYTYSASHGDSTLCPVCRAPVMVQCAAKVGQGKFCPAETTVMSASLLPGEPGERPLVLTGWSVRKLVDRHANESYDAKPMEAYVFEKGSAYKLNGWSNAYSGSVGYFVQINREWRQPVNWRESWGQEDNRIFGLTAELVADSCLHNSKFDLYMDPVRFTHQAPIPYLRLYQVYPQVENLVMQGCSHILDELFQDYMRASEWRENDRGLVIPHEINFEESRPAQMLGLTKEEFRWMREQGWGLYIWQVFVKAKWAGDHLTPEDVTEIFRYGFEDVDLLIGRAPVGKSIRYLMRQIEDMCAASDIYNEYAEDYDIQPNDEQICVQSLVDYWIMAEEAGWDLNDPAVKWPKCLWTAHDGAETASRVARSRKAAASFKERTKKLGAMVYASGGLMIFPAFSQESLNQEGEKLHHCVARYGESHALGSTAIFFIRRVGRPTVPYYTLELDEKKLEVRQNRGNHNCARTDEVRAFEEEWLGWIRSGCKRKKDGTPVGAEPVPVPEELMKHEEVSVA